MEIIRDTSGFYKAEEGQLLHAPNFVSAPDYDLSRTRKDEYTYPVHGWHWFDSQQDAELFYHNT